MKVYIWKDIGQVSYNYHPEGGLVVVAESEARAREIANSYPDIEVLEGEKPDVCIAAGEGEEERVIPFPNAGCC